MGFALPDGDRSRRCAAHIQRPATSADVVDDLVVAIGCSPTPDALTATSRICAHTGRATVIVSLHGVEWWLSTDAAIRLGVHLIEVSVYRAPHLPPVVDAGNALVVAAANAVRSAIAFRFRGAH